MMNFKIIISITLLLSFSVAQAAKLKIAAVNFKVNGGVTIKEHFERIDSFAKKAREVGVRFLLLPELAIFDLISINPKESEIAKELDIVAEKFSVYEANLVKIAEKNKIAIVGASAIVKVEQKYINRSFYIAENGDVSYQDKIYPTPWEKKYNFKGAVDKTPVLFKDKDFSFAILICHDAEFPDLSLKLAGLAPEVIFVPSQTDDLNGLNRVKYTSIARAVEQMAYVVVTGTTGNKDAPWHEYVGHNIFTGPQNKYFKQGFEISPEAETMSIFEIDISMLRKSREDSSQIYPARDMI
jgi:predicted amidohydrolase